MAVREGRAAGEDAVAIVSPGRLLAAWAQAGELPPEVWDGVECLRRGEMERGCGLLFDGDVDVDAVRAQVESLRVSDPDIDDVPYLYAQLTARSNDPSAPKRKCRAYVPTIPTEARWAWERHRALGRTERMITLRSEITAELDEWGVEDLALRREQAGYFEAIDAGQIEYRNVVEGDTADRMRESSKGKGKGK